MERHPPRTTAAPCLATAFLEPTKICKEREELTDTRNQNPVPDPTTEPSVLDLPRHKWSTINRIRTMHGLRGHQMHKQRIKDTPRCECGQESVDHITSSTIATCLVSADEFPRSTQLHPKPLSGTAIQFCCSIHVKEEQYYVRLCHNARVWD